MKNSRTIAIDAILFALTIVLTVISAAIPAPLVNIAFLMLIPLLVSAQVERLGTALFTGLVLGLTSLVCAFIFPNPTSPIFYNPLVSVLPRILIGLVSWSVFRYLNMLLDKTRINKKIQFTLTSVLSSAIGVVTNTGLVIAAIWLFFNGKEVGGMIINGAFLTGLISLNFVIEIVACAVIVPPVAYGVKKALRQPLGVNGFKYRIAPKAVSDKDDNTQTDGKD